MDSFTVEDIFINWRYRLKNEEGIAMFLGGEARKSYLTDLIESLVATKISYEDAKTITKRVQDTLVTKEGKKGKGKYSGWAQTVGDQYLEILSSYYVKIDTSGVAPLESIEQNPTYQFSSDLTGGMKKWLTEKYGYSDFLYQETKRIGSTFWEEYLEDSFKV